MNEPWGELGDLVAGTRFGVVRHVAETGSTNLDLVAEARAGADDGTVLVADHQTAGRGRLDRSWAAPAGSSLLVSILLRPTLPLDELYLIPTALGVAAAETCRAFQVGAGIKWPNDLVVEWTGTTRKLSGMLAESVLDGDHLEAVVMGIGINVNWPAELPAELADIAVAMNHVNGHPVPRTAVLAMLLWRFDHALGLLDDPTGRSELMGSYERLSATLGRRVRVELGGETVVGEAVGLTAEGHLLVADEHLGRPREVVAGDVVLLRDAH